MRLPIVTRVIASLPALALAAPATVDHADRTSVENWASPPSSGSHKWNSPSQQPWNSPSSDPLPPSFLDSTSLPSGKSPNLLSNGPRTPPSIHAAPAFALSIDGPPKPPSDKGRIDLDPLDPDLWRKLRERVPRNPKLWKEMRQLAQKPEMWKKFREWAQSPKVWKETQKRITLLPDSWEKMKEQARNPENWKELEGLEHMPEIRKRLEEEVDNPELWRKIKEQSLDPAYWREVEEQIQNPDIWKKMEFSAKDPKAWEFLEEQKEARPFDLLPLPPSDVTKPPSPPEPTPSPSPTPTPTPTPPPPPPEPKCLQWRDTLLGKHTLEKVKPGGEPSPHLDCLEDVMHVALRRARHKHTEEASDLQTENITRVLAKFASESKYLNENRHMTDKFGPRWSTAFKKMDGWQQLRFLNWQGVFKANEFLEDDEWMKGHLRPDGHEGAETMDLYYQREFGKYQIAVLEWRFLDGPKPDIEGW